MITFGKLYFHPQISLIGEHIGLGVTMYWGNNDTARYIAFNCIIINLSINLNFGEKK